MAARTKSSGSKDTSANLGFEGKLWLGAHQVRSNMDAAEYLPIDMSRPASR